MKILRTLALVGISLLTSNAFAMELKVTIDPQLLTQGNSLGLGYRVISCGGRAVCTDNYTMLSQSSVFAAENVPQVLKFLENSMHDRVPARTADKLDSYIKLDIIDNKNKRLNLPNCKKVINGLESLKINVTSAGCTYSK